MGGGGGRLSGGRGDPDLLLCRVVAAHGMHDPHEIALRGESGQVCRDPYQADHVLRPVGIVGQISSRARHSAPFAVGTLAARRRLSIDRRSLRQAVFRSDARRRAVFRTPEFGKPEEVAALEVGERVFPRLSLGRLRWEDAFRLSGGRGDPDLLLCHKAEAPETHDPHEIALRGESGHVYSDRYQVNHVLPLRTVTGV